MTQDAARRPAPVHTVAATADDMEELGRRLGESVMAVLGSTPRALVFLRGPLGAGKTTLSRGVLRAFGVEGIVRSPTYTLVEVYQSGCGCVVHADFYRLRGLEEVEYLGLDTYLETSFCLVEWPENGGAALPRPDLEITIDTERAPRSLSICPLTSQGRALCAALKTRVQVSESLSET